MDKKEAAIILVNKGYDLLERRSLNSPAAYWIEKSGQAACSNQAVCSNQSATWLIRAQVTSHEVVEAFAVYIASPAEVTKLAREVSRIGVGAAVAGNIDIAEN